MENNHLVDILKLIKDLQKDAEKAHDAKYNTRPISLYLCNNSSLNILYSNGETSIFRVEKLDNNCLKVRLLINNNNVIEPTDEYAIINLGCISAIKCFNDTLLSL